LRIVLHVGVDLAETQPHQVCFMDEHKILAEFRVPNDASGLSELLRQIARHEPDPTQVVIAAERPDGPFVGGLLDAGYTVYAINPKAMERYRERHSVGGPKSDLVDARCLAGLLRTDREAYRPIKPDSPLTRELRMLTRDLSELEKTQTMLALQLRAALYASFPGALQIFSDLTAPSALGVLKTFPTLHAIREATDDQLAATLKRHGYGSPAAKVRSLREVLAAEQFRVDDAVVAAKSVLIKTLAETLLTLHEQIRRFEHQIKDRFERHPDREVFLSLRGAGPRLAVRIAAELGDDRQRFASAADVAAFAGTAPVTRQSGKSRVAHFRRACCKPFRETMHLFAFCSLNWNQWARLYYDAKRRQGKKHAEALRCLACIWLRIIYAMWRDGTTYDPARFLQARAAQLPVPAPGH
jgi:transposase